MKKWKGNIDNKEVVVIGDTLKNAMANAGYLPQTQFTSTGKIIGRLTTGQRFSFRIACESDFHTPTYNQKLPERDRY